jgi:nucleoside-diphosphate-sugar epimerase
MPASRALVTGGTGFIGRNLTRVLLAAEEFSEVRVLTRCRETAGLPVHAKLRIIEGSFADPTVARTALQEVQVVYHLAAIKLGVDIAVAESDFLHVNRDAAVALAKLAADVGVSTFVYFSSTGVYGRAGSGALDEQSPCIPENIYERSKMAAERELDALALRVAMKVVVLRPSNVFGEEHPRRHLLAAMKVVKRGFVVVPSPSGWLNFVHVDDVALAARDVALGMDRFQQPARLILNCPVGADVFFAQLAAIINPRARILRLPASLVKGSAAIIGVFERFGRRPSILRRKLKELTAPSYFSDSMARALLPNWPYGGLNTGLRATAEHYRRNGWL